jgi:pimeloyl-ACP methyl ester carboxylesterase
MKPIRTERVRHGWVEANGLRLHHLVYGDEGRPIVCLHGVTGHGWAWHAVAPSLTDMGRVLAFDLRGHGDSQWSADAAYGSEHHAADVLGRLDALGAGEVDVVGSSWGALIAIAIAAAEPERVRRLAIVDVEASFEQGETDVFPRPHAYATHEDAVAFERQGNPHAPDALLDVVAAGATRPGPDGTLVPKHDPFFFERWPFRGDDRWAQLPSLTMPTLLVHAEASFVRCEVMRRMAEAIPNARLVHLPDTTHVVPVDNPEGLIEHLAPFLAEG